MRTDFIVFLVSIALSGIGQDRNSLDTSMQGARANHPRKIIIGAIELHYIEKGKGEPLILLYGGQDDDRS